MTKNAKRLSRIKVRNLGRHHPAKVSNKLGVPLAEQDNVPLEDDTSVGAGNAQAIKEVLSEVSKVAPGLDLSRPANDPSSSQEGEVAKQQLLPRKKAQPIQDAFLETLRDEQVPVSIYLINGIKLQGAIKAFDLFVILLANSSAPPQMVYKQTISAIVPGCPMN